MFSLSWERMCEENELISHFIEIQILIALLWFENKQHVHSEHYPTSNFTVQSGLWALFSRVRSSSVIIIHFPKGQLLLTFF